MKTQSAIVTAGLVMLFALLLSSSVFAQDLQIEPGFDTERWLPRSETITFKLDTVLQAEDGQLAIFLGATDMTDLFENFGDSLVYNPSFMLLPPGESEIIFYLVSPENQWQEVSRLTLKVKTVTGFQKADFAGKVSITNSGQIAEGHDPIDNRPARATFQEFNGQANLTSEHVRDLFAVRSQWDFVGAGEKQQALRFGEKGDNAAQIDLAGYSLEVQSGKAHFSMGHISHGRNEHLISAFASRGSMLKLDLTRSIDFSMAILNSQTVVGWDNFTGINRKNNRIYSSAFGVDVFSRPGALRIEGSYMDGSSLPLDGFNQGSITDAEKSRGYGFRLSASNPNERLQFEGGFARSKFTNPNDPLLAGGLDIVPVQDETKAARFARVNLGLLQNVTLLPDWQASFTLNIRHEKVDPLYRSLASYARADFLENAVALQGNVGVISLQIAHSRSEDNLDEIPSILKTKTRSNTVAVAVPFQAMFARRVELMPLLPVFSCNFARTHQFGDQLPEDSGFSESHVPDQVSSQRGASLDWTGNAWRLGYRLGHSLQDNRQPGREAADFENINHAISLGLSPGSSIDLALEVAFEKAQNKEVDRTDKTTNFSVGFNMPTSDKSNLNLNLTATHSVDNLQTTFNDNVNLSSQWSYRFNYDLRQGRPLFQGQLFIRYSRTAINSEDTVFGINNELMNWTINTGVSVSLF
jgi:hypothetical protein